MNNEPDYDNLYFERTKMTRKVFQANNKDDVDLLLSILSEDVYKITQSDLQDGCSLMWYKGQKYPAAMYEIAIDWHDKTEITRPIPLATKKDIGKICAFWEEGNEKYPVYAELVDFYEDASCYKYQAGHESCCYEFCRRLTKQEIEELC